MIASKNEQVERNILAVAWHPKLIQLYQWIKDCYPEALITSAYREGDKGVHGTDPLRGFDLRSWVFDDPESVKDDINEMWVYDPTRPDKKVAILHDVGQGMHFHLQVHDNTQFLGGIV
jgi:hypothetical protein